MVAPVPVDLPKECQKAAKILNSFVDPVDGLDRLVPISVLAKARGFAIFSVIRVGFILSARAGSGIVIARIDTEPDGSGGHWTAPTAIGIAGLGGGFNAGAQIIDCLVVLNSAAAVRSFSTTGSLQLGGSLSVAVGPVGRSAEASGSMNSKGSVAAMFSYSKAKGLYGGVSLEGTVLVERTDANLDAYGRGATAAAILSGRVDPPDWSRPLIDAIEKLTRTGHLADRLDRARQEEIDREYGSGLSLDRSRQPYVSRRSTQVRERQSLDDSSSSLSLSEAPRPTRERDGSGSLWGEDDAENEQDTLASLSRSSGRALAGVGASSSRTNAATGTLFDTDFDSNDSPSRPSFSQSSSRIRTRATPPPPINMGEYAFGSAAGGSITNTPSAGRRTPGRPGSSGGRRTSGGSISLFSRSATRTPGAVAAEDSYASYFDANHGQGSGSPGAMASTPGSAGSKRPGFLRHRTRSSVGSKKSFSLVPSAFRKETPPVPGSQAFAEEELERKLRLYDEENGRGPSVGPGTMQRSYSASGASSSTAAYAAYGRSRTSPGPAAMSYDYYPSTGVFGSSSAEDGYGESSRVTDTSHLEDTYEEQLARDLALARRPSPTSAGPRRSVREDEEDDSLRRLEIIARRQRAILDAEERGESGRNSLDEFDRELQQERARLSSSSSTRFPRATPTGASASQIAKNLFTRSGSTSGDALNGTSSRRATAGRTDPFAELYESQTGTSAASPAGHSINSGAGLNRRLSSVRSSGEASLFDSAGSQSQSQFTPASSVGVLPQLHEDGRGPQNDMVMALFPFQAQVPTDLGFAKGDVIRVTKRTASRDDWWEGVDTKGQSGSFPANYTSDL
ncbi:hypothetical protein OC846_003426 [Tilletia horrida]|uniref:SH3 domain-containing protein n=1 Tax=Tilletia horrida TaxID=155126 RepID=A0AAN6GRY9_9BASI|nr:hypothetical protein OC846_003426 [Tilletia horrida]